MNTEVKLNTGTLVWQGEHWINAIATADGESPTAWISLFHTRYSPVGEGTTAQVVVPDQKIDIIATDNSALGVWITDRFLSKSSYFSPAAAKVEARFSRSGHSHREPSWLIEAGEHRIQVKWVVTEPPVIANGSFSPGTEHWTVLFFTNAATVEVDGAPIPGHPFLRDIWQPSIGGQRSSCVFALAETLLEFSG